MSLFFIPAPAVSIPTVIYHWFLTTSSYCIGWPISPAFLSDTLLTILNGPPRLLSVRADALSASDNVLATFNPMFVDIPLVIAKYTWFDSNPSGNAPSSLMILIVSPFSKVCASFNCIWLLVILLIPAALLLTLNDF